MHHPFAGREANRLSQAFSEKSQSALRKIVKFVEDSSMNMEALEKAKGAGPVLDMSFDEEESDERGVSLIVTNFLCTFEKLS